MEHSAVKIDEHYQFTITDCGIVKGVVTKKDVVGEIEVRVTEVCSTCYPGASIINELKIATDEIHAIEFVSEVRISLERLAEDIRVVLSLKGYYPHEVVTFENSDGDLLEIIVERDIKLDPYDLVVDSVYMGDRFSQTLDDYQTLRLVYGDRLFAYSFDDDDIVLEFDKEIINENY